MTGGFLIPFMGPDHRWTFLRVSILAVLLLTINADSKDSECSTEIQVRRNTVYEALVGQEHAIKCPVVFCNNLPPEVIWYKMTNNIYVPVINSSNSHIRTEWKMERHLLNGTSSLIFKNILSSDSGMYQCQSKGSVSHTIHVSVHVNGDRTTATPNNDTNNTTYPEETDNLWMYVCSAAGTVVFVIVVICMSVISMRGCKGKSKKEIQRESQYMEIPMVEHDRVQPPPRGSPGVQQSSSTRRKPQASQPDNLTLRDSEHVYGKITDDRKRQRNVVEEEGNSVVYAALNHQVPPRAAARPLRPEEECSEYAAIRLS